MINLVSELVTKTNHTLNAHAVALAVHSGAEIATTRNALRQALIAALADDDDPTTATHEPAEPEPFVILPTPEPTPEPSLFTPGTTIERMPTRRGDAIRVVAWRAGAVVFTTTVDRRTPHSGLKQAVDSAWRAHMAPAPVRAAA